MKNLRFTLLVGTVAGALPLTAAMAQPAGTPADAASRPALLLAQADTPPVPPEALERKKQLEEKVSPRGRERGGDEGGKAERPSRAERKAPDEAKPERRAAPSEESKPAPRAERPSRGGGDSADEMKRRSRSGDEERAPKPKAEEAAPKASEPKSDASESSPKTLKVPEEEKPAARSTDREERKARQSDREERRQRRDEDRKASDTEKKAPTTEEKTGTEKSTTSDEDKATIQRRSTEEKAPEGKETDKATETERQIRGTSGTTEDTNARDRDIRDRSLRDGDRDRDRAGRDRDRGDRDRNARDNDIRDDADYRDRNRDFDRRFERREEREGDRVVIKEKGDRTIIREGDRIIIRHDEDDRLRRFGHDVRTERRGDEFVTIIDRPNGVQIVTYTDRDGRLLRRVRRHNGREIVLIDNRHHRPDYDVYVELPPVRLDIPRDEYIVEANDASYDEIHSALIAPPVVPLQQNYTLDQVRSSVDVRERVRSVDLNTINFAFGDWQIPQSEVDQLDNIAKALKAIIDDNPDEVFLIEGHTDAVGSEIDNLSLSDRRAEEVAAALTQDYQIPPENLVTQGYGEQYLKVDTQEANAENRRVVVRRITPLLKASSEQ